VNPFLPEFVHFWTDSLQRKVGNVEYQEIGLFPLDGRERGGGCVEQAFRLYFSAKEAIDLSLNTSHKELLDRYLQLPDSSPSFYDRIRLLVECGRSEYEALLLDLFWEKWNEIRKTGVSIGIGSEYIAKIIPAFGQAGGSAALEMLKDCFLPELEKLVSEKLANLREMVAERKIDPLSPVLDSNGILLFEFECLQNKVEQVRHSISEIEQRLTQAGMTTPAVSGPSTTS